MWSGVKPAPRRRIPSNGYTVSDDRGILLEVTVAWHWRRPSEVNPARKQCPRERVVSDGRGRALYPSCTCKNNSLFFFPHNNTGIIRVLILWRVYLWIFYGTFTWSMMTNTWNVYRFSAKRMHSIFVYFFLYFILWNEESSFFWGRDLSLRKLRLVDTLQFKKVK